MSGKPEGGTVTCEVLDNGAIWHVLLATPKANIVDMDKAEQARAIYLELGRLAKAKHPGPRRAGGKP